MSEHDVVKLDAIMEQRAMCEGCGQEIDPTLCHCGTAIEDHRWGDGHSPIPLGCNCYRVTKEEGR